MVTVTVTDGGDDNDLETQDDNLQTFRSFTVQVTAVNDPPTLTATGDDPTFTEDGAAAGLYSSTSISTVELARKFAVRLCRNSSEAF